MQNIIFDFEVLKEDWGVVFFLEKEDRYVTIVNDVWALNRFWETYKNDLFIGFNSNGYDVWIMKSILLLNNPIRITKFIIEERRKDIWNCPGCSNIYQVFPMKVFDVKTPTVYQTNPALSLKEAESNMGETIIESSVSWDINRKLTEQELNELMYYCKNDVKMTYKIFKQKVIQDDLIIRRQLIKWINATDDVITEVEGYRFKVPRLICKLLMCRKLPPTMLSDRNIQIPQILIPQMPKAIQGVLMAPYDEQYYGFFHTNYCKKVLSNMSKEERAIYVTGTKCCTQIKKLKKIKFDLLGVMSKFGSGGLHGAIPNYAKTIEGNTRLIHIDVKSYYPNLMMKYNLLSRAVTKPELYAEIYKLRFLAKSNKDPRQSMYKLILNMTFGETLNKYLDMYDPLKGLNIPLLGQVLLIYCIQKFDKIPGLRMVQYNTDGIIIEYEEGQFDLIKSIITTWEQETGFEMEYTHLLQIFQKDVNNYIIRTEDGDIKTKGTDVKQYQKASFLKNHISFISTALVETLLYKTPFNDLWSKHATLSSLSFLAKHTIKFDGMEIVTPEGEINTCQKTNRVYPLNIDLKSEYFGKIGTMYKFKMIKGVKQYFKIPNCPEHVLIFNCQIEDENDRRVFDVIDKEWYRQKLNNLIFKWFPKLAKHYINL